MKQEISFTTNTLNDNGQLWGFTLSMEGDGKSMSARLDVSRTLGKPGRC